MTTTLTETENVETTASKAAPRKFKSVPLEPLWEIARHRAGANSAARTGFTAVEFADMVGHNVKAVNRWQAAGTIPVKSADKAASALGVAAYFVWYEDWLDAYDDYDDIASGKLDAAIAKDLAEAEAVGETIKDGKVVGRGWTILARRQEQALINQIAMEALVVPGDESTEWFIDPEVPLIMTDVYVMEKHLKERGLLIEA